MKNRKIKNKPWIDNEPFILFMKHYQQEMYLFFCWKLSCKDKFLWMLIDRYLKNRRYKEVLILGLQTHLSEAKLRECYEDRLNGIWEVWFYIQNIARMKGGKLPEEFNSILKAISDVTIPNMWSEFSKESH